MQRALFSDLCIEILALLTGVLPAANSDTNARAVQPLVSVEVQAGPRHAASPTDMGSGNDIWLHAGCGYDVYQLLVRELIAAIAGPGDSDGSTHTGSNNAEEPAGDP